MWHWNNVYRIIMVCGSVATVWLSTSIINGLPNIFLLPFSENDQNDITPLTHLNISQHFKENEHFASSVWCVRRLDGSKKCIFKNIFFMPQFDEHLVFLLNEHSVISGVESVEALKDINLSTIKNHSKCVLKLVVLTSTEYIQRQEFLVIGVNTLIMKRFKPDNIMHVIHDDLLPLFVTFKELCQGNLEVCLSSYYLMFLDGNDNGPYFEWYKLFSNRNPIALKNQNKSILIKTSVIGLSLESIWFDYGFKTTQGPIINPYLNALFLKQFTDFIKGRLGIILHNTTPKSKESVLAVFLNRVINRKILNGNLIERYILEAYANVNIKNVHIMKMDLLTNDSRSLISSIQNADLLIGIHGSAMVFSIFMPEGSKIVEVFPYGIQPAIVSPIKALCSLLKTYYSYIFWVNNNESNSITHPEYPPLHGGITHLSSLEQENIMKSKLVPPVKCCHNPLYLFRMFQDTIVDESFYYVLSEFLNQNKTFNSEEYMEILQTDNLNKWYFPPPVFNLTCECILGEIKLLWNYPFNKSSDIVFSIYFSNSFAATTNLTHFNISMLECERVKQLEYKELPMLSVWVKTLENTKESVDSFKLCNFKKLA